MISATFLIDSSACGHVSFCRSKVKTVHERIPLAGLSKLPSIPQIAKVKATPREKVASSFSPGLASGWGAGLSWVGFTLGEGKATVHSLALDCTDGVVVGAVGRHLCLPDTLPISSSV